MEENGGCKLNVRQKLMVMRRDNKWTLVSSEWSVRDVKEIADI